LHDSAALLIQVLVVDDSAVVRQVMQAVLSQESDMEVTVAADPIIALHKMKQVRPHVIILDLEMPQMDGLTFLRKVMAEDPIPTLICSSVAGRGTVAAIRALEEGAIGIVTKPKLGVGNFLHESAVMLIDTVRSAASARMRKRTSVASPQLRKLSGSKTNTASVSSKEERIVAMGASTGGTEALAQILGALPTEAPGIVIVQHMPEQFTAAFAKWLDTNCAIHVKEAADGDRVKRGWAFVAPGNRHSTIRRASGHLTIQVSDGPLVSRHRPSVNALFRSVAQTAGDSALGVILTGMGDDGADGLLEMRAAGAFTIAQNEASCVVFGMPKEAIRRGAAHRVLALDAIPAAVASFGIHGSKLSRSGGSE
jgi:two-component system, chemotaxis family, protein-glutamate methylesterase/glutaminase